MRGPASRPCLATRRHSASSSRTSSPPTRSAPGSPSRRAGASWASAWRSCAESAWFLSLPVRQTGPAGAAAWADAMLEACVGQGADLLATCIESIQPVSAGLYATFGMAPLAPLYVMTGRLRDTRPLAAQHVLSAGAASRDPDPHPVIADIDRATLGYAHPEDHRFWVAMDRVPYLFRDATGDPRGYGYVATSGRIGPVAMLDAELLPEAIDHLMAAIEPPDAWLLFVPGQSDRASVTASSRPALRWRTGHLLLHRRASRLQPLPRRQLRGPVRAGDGERDSWLALAVEACDETDRLAMAAFRTDMERARKADGTLVTATDRAIEERVRDRIRARHPDHGLVGEEYGPDEADRPRALVHRSHRRHQQLHPRRAHLRHARRRRARRNAGGCRRERAGPAPPLAGHT